MERRNESWHHLKIEKVAKKLRTNFQTGLSLAEVVRRKRKFGENKLPEEKQPSKLQLFLRQCQSPLIYLLIAAGFISFLLGEITDSLAIFLAVFINALFGFLEENKVAKTLSSLKKILKVKAVVIRDGYEKEIFQKEIVPGDILVLNPGDQIPADARLIKAENLEVSEAVLTGEWLPAKKKTGVLPSKTPLAERDNMVYMGTTVEAGFGKAVVTAIGENTEMGKIARLVKETKEEETPLQKKVHHFSKTISLVISLVCLFIFLDGLLSGRNWLTVFTTSVAIAVGGIPEALPVVIVIVLAIGMERILRKKGLIRRLSSVETLGSTSIICTDKTRTLTEGKMKLVAIKASDEKLALEIAVLTARTFIENPDDDISHWRLCGSPTDRALVWGAAQRGVVKPLLEKKIKVHQFPFEPSSKFLVSWVKKKEGEFLYCCGAPERILPLCQNKEEFLPLLDQLTEKGLRVVGMAYKKCKNKTCQKIKIGEINDLIFVGFAGLKDSLRKGVKRAFEICSQAGIRPIIVTGDHQKTAQAVAEELGLTIKPDNIITGMELDEWSDQQLENKIEKIKVFARSEPRHKIRIIKAWQEKGEVVAMTGDGVNDAPALKKADIGIAVGSGTEAAKAAADLILLNDSFSIIVKAVEEGRVILDNIRKAIAYILSDSFCSVILVGFSILFRWPLPILPAQILWNNIVEDTLPDIAYAFEPQEEGVMKRKPQPRHLHLLTKEMKILIFCTGLIDEFFKLFLFWFLWHFLKLDLAYVRTMIFGSLCLDTAFVIYCYRSLRKNIWQLHPFSNPWLVVSSLVVFLTFSLAVYFPPLQTLLHTVPLGWRSWLVLTGIGIFTMLLIEATKWYFIARHETEE